MDDLLVKTTNKMKIVDKEKLQLYKIFNIIGCAGKV